jgi:hypothetical protein
MRLKRIFAVLIAALMLGCCFGSTASATPWSTPVKIYTPQTPGYGLIGLSCASASFCAAIDYEENAITYNGSSWSNKTKISGSGSPPRTVSCPSSSFCVVTNVRSGAIVYDGSSWSSPSNIDSKGYIIDVSCPSVSFCAAVDGEGYALTYNGGSWSTPVYVAYRLASVSCTSASFCMAGDESGNFTTYNGSSWSTPVNIDGAGYLYGMSCKSSSFCVATDNHGNALTYNGSSWSAPVNIDSQELYSVSCPSVSFCVVVGEGANAHIYDGSAWHTFAGIDSNGNLTVSCPSVSFCMVVDFKGYALTYTGEQVPSNTTVPTITGNAIVGQTLNEVHAEWSNSPVEYIIQWERCDEYGITCGPISGATSSSYVLTAADVGHRIRVMENARNLTGEGVPIWSDSTAIVQEPGSEKPEEKPTEKPGGGSGGNTGGGSNPGGGSKPPKKVVNCVVPNVKGKTLSQAKKLLSKQHCGLGKVTRSKPHGKHHGTYKVISQEPRAGKVLPKGARIALLLRK